MTGDGDGGVRAYTWHLCRHAALITVGYCKQSSCMRVRACEEEGVSIYGAFLRDVMVRFGRRGRLQRRTLRVGSAIILT